MKRAVKQMFLPLFLMITFCYAKDRNKHHNSSDPRIFMTFTETTLFCAKFIEKRLI